MREKEIDQIQHRREKDNFDTDFTIGQNSSFTHNLTTMNVNRDKDQTIIILQNNVELV